MLSWGSPAWGLGPSPHSSVKLSPALSPSEQLSHFLFLNLGLKPPFFPPLSLQWALCGVGRDAAQAATR